MGSAQIIHLLIVIFCAVVNSQFEGDSCIRKYDNAPGICRNARSCPKVREDYKYGIPLTICAYLSGQPIVCCPGKASNSNQPTQFEESTRPFFNEPGSNENRLRISSQKCSKYAELTTDKILINPLSLGSSSSHEISITRCDFTTPLLIGGEKAKAGEFPHMAALGWRSFDGTLSFKCGGSLISEKFVLTAAHCSRADGAGPSIVRLGDQNLKSKNDGLVEEDYPIAEFIKHEQYRRSSFYYDIAVVKLSRNVIFSKTIRPACLWQSDQVNYTKTIASGWGYTEVGGHMSDELMKVELDVIGNSQCNSFFDNDKLSRGILNSQMCAGVLEGGKDTCNGDSGGPIQVTTSANKCLFHVIGLTSFGSPFCGIKNSPGVYTRISSYLDWIEEKVWGN